MVRQFEETHEGITVSLRLSVDDERQACQYAAYNGSPALYVIELTDKTQSRLP